ncbi:MAG: hypothetical protein JWQ13_332 [Ramlibacter sp.]|jgi:hypothetical protein|nr:hypothetical protein [Ramlibacter sp.]
MKKDLLRSALAGYFAHPGLQRRQERLPGHRHLRPVIAAA